MSNVKCSSANFLKFLSHLFIISTICRSISVANGFNNHMGRVRTPTAIVRTAGGSNWKIMKFKNHHSESHPSTYFSSRSADDKLFATTPRNSYHGPNDVVFSALESNERRAAAGLFPSKKTTDTKWNRSSVRLQMTTQDGPDGNVSENDGDNNNPLVALWNQMRKLAARLWAIVFLKPLRWIKSVFKNDDTRNIDVKVKDEEESEKGLPAEIDTSIETEEGTEKSHEDVVITEIENLVANESSESTPDDLSTTSKNVETDKAQTTPTSGPNTSTLPESRQATSTIDLTGNWTLIVDDTFKSQYDEYLRKLGQPVLIRTVASTVIGSTKEETRQMDDGRKLYIKGSNVRGSWERTMETSEATVVPTSPSPRDHAVEGHVLKPMITADDEEVEVASWWEEGGTVHKSWVVGGKKYGGGDFENRRYLMDNGNILVCESTFHPNEEGREKARVTWRFLREGAVYGDAAVEFPNFFDVFASDEEKKRKKTKEGDVRRSPSDAEGKSEPRIIVGDILDDVTTAEEARVLESSTTTAKVDIEAEIERESWVPPSGERWAIAAPGVDLSGKWKLIITEKFKEEYDEFLKSLGQPLIVRGAAVVLIGNTREETKQSDGGRTLYIKGINAKGIWERTLTSSGSDYETTLTPNADGSYDHTSVPIVTADSEHVMAQSWWENDGTVHVSYTLGVKKYGGGSFESRRYLDPNNADVYVCDSTFHPNDTLEGREPSHLRWKFIREGKSYYVGE